MPVNTCAHAGQLADQAAPSPVKRGEWPELALFDCYACHHDLKNPAWRQERKTPTGTPGRPGMQEWPFALTKIAAKALDVPQGEVDAALADFRKAIGSRPFGDPKDVTTKALASSDWFRTKANEVEKKSISREAGVAMLKDIAALAATETLDYDSARQLVWALNVIDADLNAKYPNAAKIKPIIDSLGKDMLILNLRDGSKAATAIPGEKKERQTVEVALDKVLPRVAGYTPAEFRAKAKDIADLLK